jgi:hypothetical protein
VGNKDPSESSLPSEVLVETLADVVAVVSEEGLLDDVPDVDRPRWFTEPSAKDWKRISLL